MENDNNELGRVPKIVREKPINAAVFSKLTANRDVNTSDPTRSNLPAIAAQTQERIKNNESIVQLFPDVELSIQILTSSIISPNDMLTTNLDYSLDDLKIPVDIKSSVLDTIKQHVNGEYGLLDKLPTILKEAMFMNGAYVEAIIPEASLDDIIHQYDPIHRNDGLISTEELRERYERSTNQFLGKGRQETYELDMVTKRSSYKDANGDLKHSISVEDFKINKINAANFRPKMEGSIQRNISCTTEDLGITITDNPNILKLPDELAELAMKNAKQGYRRNYNVGHESSKLLDSILKGGMTDENERSFYKKAQSFRPKDYIHVQSGKDASRRSIGAPLVMKLPVECTIPVHVIDNPSKHLGYFIILNQNGTPISSTDYVDPNSNDDYVSNGGSNNDSKLALIKKTQRAFFGLTQKDIMIQDLEGIYSKLVEDMLKSRLKDGIFGDIADIRDATDLYRVMLYRALKNQDTKILFLPSELIQYYAFEYRDNGTGKSMLEKAGVMFSMRSILLFARLKAYVDNSVTVTKVTANIDENDPDPWATAEKIMSETLKTRATQLPIGLTRVDDMVEWTHKMGFAYNFKHPALPETEIEHTEEAAGRIIPDENIDKEIKERILMSFGLTPEIVESGYAADFATTIVSKNILFAKRIVQLQNQFNPQVTEHVRKIINSDYALQDKIMALIEPELEKIKAIIKEAADEESGIDLDKIGDRELTEYIMSKFANEILVTLPSPDITEVGAMKEAFNNYKDSLEPALDIIFDSNAFPTDVAGDLGSKLDMIKSIMKAELLRKWMAENNYLSDLISFFVKNDEGKPVYDILAEWDHTKDFLVENVSKFIKQTHKHAEEINKRFEDAMQGDQPAPAPEQPAENNDSGGDNNDNAEGDEGGDDNAGGDDVEAPEMEDVSPPDEEGGEEDKDEGKTEEKSEENDRLEIPLTEAPEAESIYKSDMMSLNFKALKI